MSTYGTAFVESEVLLAIQQEDYETAKQHLEGMTRSERSSLIRACNNLSHLAGDVQVIARQGKVAVP